ncbi:MAG TPA: GMC family oxidoreductase [Puia sp.]|jgi:choline dehydrogenase-like flavoprotein|nr:GMC family oxidoreductase [Puia sp.]
MYVDARTLENETLIEGDICIIGAGAAGISIALEYMNSPYKVILLEGGGFEYEERIQELYEGKTTGQPYYPIKSSELHYFGGTTGHWGGMCALFDPIAFQKRDWIDKSGWPITQETLLPYYKRAHVYLEIEVYEYDLDYWQKKDPALISIPFDKEWIWTKLWQFSKPTRFGTRYKDTIVNAKNIHLYTYANMVDITTNENISEVKTVTVKNYAGKTHRVAAKYFVLACAGIQNARMLLAANKQASKGLGNDNDLVGRYFMEHLELKSAELWVTQKSELKLYMNENPRVHGELAVMPKKQEEYQILNGIISFTALENKTPNYIKTWTNSDPRENLKDHPQPAYKALYHQVKDYFNSFNSDVKNNLHQAFQVTLRMEQAPNPLSRVTLSEEKDELGVPRASLNWVFTSLEKRSIRKIYEIIGQQAGATSFGRLKLLEELWDEKDENVPSTTSGGWHHMGTTRMSDDPKNGVVNADCKVHGIHNLFIAGSSCFATGGGANPTFTLVALSIRLADHLKEIISKHNTSSK